MMIILILLNVIIASTVSFDSSYFALMSLLRSTSRMLFDLSGACFGIGRIVWLTAANSCLCGVVVVVVIQAVFRIG